MLFVNEVYGKAEEAIEYYTSIFHHTKTGNIARYPGGMEPDKEGTIMYADFMLEDQWFAAMDSAAGKPDAGWIYVSPIEQSIPINDAS